jgi:hypothetical protein
MGPGRSEAMSETENKRENQQPRTSGLAQASMVLGVLSVLCGFCVPASGYIFGTAAVIAGLSALLQVKMSRRLLQGRLLATVGIITGVIVAPSVVILELRHHRHTYHRACRVLCGTNMAALAKAMVRYANDYDRPVSNEWCDRLLRAGLAEDKNFICRGSATTKGQSSYGMNKNTVGMKPSNLSPDSGRCIAV